MRWPLLSSSRIEPSRWIGLIHERVDVALISSEMAGYEIKRARDTVKRLPRQMRASRRTIGIEKLFSALTIYAASADRGTQS